MIDKTILSLHLKKAREMLINVPQEMFDMFFVTLVEDVGWPFMNTSDSAEGTDWQRVFNPFSLRQIVDFKWVRREFVFDRGMFWDQSIGDVEAVVQNCFGLLPRFGNYDYDRCRNSTMFHFGNVVKGKGFGDPIVLAMIPGDDKLKILDGNHRMAAALMYEQIAHKKVDFEAWVAVCDVGCSKGAKGVFHEVCDTAHKSLMFSDGLFTRED